MSATPTFPLVPTARSVALTALAAPVAFVIAATAPSAWVIAPAAGLALLALVLLDGAVAGRLVDHRLVAPGNCEVGEPFELAILASLQSRVGGHAPRAALSFDPRLGEGGRGELRLEPVDGQSGGWSGKIMLAANRRGTAIIDSLWLRWSGPLGLGARQVLIPLEHEVRIWPDLSPVRSPLLQTYLRDAEIGLIARRVRGEGTQFESLTEYESGMDRRRIDWKSSARQTRLFARENESERNNQIVFAFDCGQAMCEPIDGLPRIDRAVSAALTASYVALKGGDKVSLFGFARQVELMTPFANQPRSFHRLQSAAAALDYHSEEPNFTLGLATLASRLKRRSMIVLFSEFTDTTSAELMIESIARLVQRHLVLFVTLEDVELSALAGGEPDTVGDIAVAVTADSLARQRALVLERLRQMGVDVIEAPWEAITYNLMDRYLQIKRGGRIG